MRTLKVNTGSPYEILISRGLLDHCAEPIRALYGEKTPKIALVTDDVVDALYAERVCGQLEAAGLSVQKFVFPHGEHSKSLDTLSRLYDFLAREQITRSDVLVALGGGVCGDLTGFAAATWQRGIDFVQIPTTFLAMIDSSVGGKTGVNIEKGKNLVGAFWQPRLVLCDPDVLSTLSDEIFADGSAEAVKYGAILDETLFSHIENGGFSTELEEIIHRCVDLKREVVEQDEFDTGLRQILNFGHTFGHAIEQYHHYGITHGKGVAIGMAMMTEASERAGLTPSGTAQRIIACLKKCGLPTECAAPFDALCQNALGDKKRNGSQITLCILEQLGKATLHTIQTDQLSSFIGGRNHD